MLNIYSACACLHPQCACVGAIYVMTSPYLQQGMRLPQRQSTPWPLMHELNVSLSEGEDVMVPKTFVEDAKALREPSEAEKSNK